VSTPSAIEWLFRPASGDTEIDRKALASLLLEIAHDLKPELRSEQNGLVAGDLRLEQVRQLLLGREIEILARLSRIVEDPEQLATAVGRVLPTAIAEATSDARLGPVLAPVMERATESSISSNPRKLVEILYPLIVPTVGKSIRETIDATFQSLNQTLKYSLTWRGLKWRLEAWRTGTTFAAVVLKHTLVYRVEHVFLIHRHTGLLITHVAAEDSASQDPQLVSSMLVAIQDFVRDSFTGDEQQSLDQLRFGDLRLWCEPGPFAMLVAVIRGDPPEQLHESLREALSQIHADRHQALETFDGDSSGFGDVEAQLREFVVLKEEKPPRVSFGRLIFFGWLALMVLFVAAYGFRTWRDNSLWQNYITQLQEQPGIVVTEAGRRDGKFQVIGMRDPLAADPQAILKQNGFAAGRVISQWTPYEALEPQFVLKRLEKSLAPPPTVMMAVDGNRIVANGSAPAAWIERAQFAARTMPAGAPAFDISNVRNIDAEPARLWADYLARLRAQPGIVVTEAGKRDGKFVISGLRDPLAVNPATVLRQAGIDPANVIAQWMPYQALEPQFVLRRLEKSLDPPSTVTMAVDGDRIVAKGSAPAAWIERAQFAARTLPAGAPTLSLADVSNIDETPARLWSNYIARLRAQPGIVVTEAGKRDGKFVISGLRDPLAVDPMAVLREAGIDPVNVVSHWTPYQSLDPQFVLRRLQASLAPPASVTLAIDGDRIVAKGAAPAQWLDRARVAAELLPSGAPVFDLADVRNLDEEPAKLWADYIAKLRKQPGIVITSSGKRDGKFFVNGLRDPLAADPLTLLKETGISPADVVAQWAPYQALEPQFVLTRLQSSLDLPPTVTLGVENNQIVARGAASPPWIARARQAGRMLPAGGPALDLSHVRNINEGAIGRLRKAIESKSIHFDVNASLPSKGQDELLDQIAQSIKDLAHLSTVVGVTPRVTLIGHADSAGRGTNNLSLSLARSEAVRALLKKRGVNPDLLAVRGAGALEPLKEEATEADRLANRRVSFTVGIDE